MNTLALTAWLCILPVVVLGEDLAKLVDDGEFTELSIRPFHYLDDSTERDPHLGLRWERGSRKKPFKLVLYLRRTGPAFHLADGAGALTEYRRQVTEAEAAGLRAEIGRILRMKNTESGFGDLVFTYRIEAVVLNHKGPVSEARSVSYEEMQKISKVLSQYRTMLRDPTKANKAE